MGFSRQEYCSGLPCPSPGDLPDPEIEPVSPALASGFFTTSATWKAQKIGSVQFGHSVVSSFLRPRGLQHSRLPCPSATRGVFSNSCPLSQRCHPTISSSIVPFSSCLQSFPASGSSLMSQLFASGGQTFSFSINPSSEYSGLIFFTIDWFDLLAVQGMLKNHLQHHSSKASILQHSAFFMVQLSHPYMTIGKTIALTRQTVISKVMSLLFNMLSRLVIAFLPRSNHLLISWLHSSTAVILELQKNKVCHCFHCLPIYSAQSDGTRCCDLCFLNV